MLHRHILLVDLCPTSDAIVYLLQVYPLGAQTSQLLRKEKVDRGAIELLDIDT